MTSMEKVSGDEVIGVILKSDPAFQQCAWDRMELRS